MSHADGKGRVEVRPIARMLAIGSVLFAFGGPARAETFSISMGGTTVELGAAKPGEPLLDNFATQLNVNASAPYTLQATAPATMSTSVAPKKAIPISRLAWRVHAFGGAFTPFAAGTQTVVGGQAPTPASGRTHTLDLMFTPQIVDAPSKGDGSDPYSATIMYSVTAGTVDSSYAYPNPFSPDGDGASDRTTFHWWQSGSLVIDVNVYQADGTTIVRKLTTARPLGTGEQSIVWDGRDDNRQLVPEGEYVYRIAVAQGQPTNAGLVIASGLVGVERALGAGTATVTGKVTSNLNGSAVAGATVDLVRDGGTRIGRTTSDGMGNFTFALVPQGTFYLAVTAPLFFPYQSALFEVATGATVVHDVVLVHNHSLTITKVADTPDAAPGDVVSFVVTVSTQGGVETVDDVTVRDDLPAGLRLVPGSARVDGRKVPSDGLRDHALVFGIGQLPPGRKVVLTYDCAVVAGTKVGRLTNSARAMGTVMGIPVVAGPTYAAVYIHDGDTGDRSLIFGQIYIDKNRNGIFDAGDTPVDSAARVILDDGTAATVDANGRYSIKGVREGARAMMVVLLDRSALITTLAPSGPSKMRLVTLLDGVALQADFGFTPEEAADLGDGGSKATLGVVDATVGIDFATGGTVLSFIGRVAVFFERDLGGGYSLNGSIDTRRDPRDELGIGRDLVPFQPETGDTSFTARGAPDKIGATLRAPWGKIFLGRTAPSFEEYGELLTSFQTFFGLDATVTMGIFKARAFVGVTDSMPRADVFQNDGTAGPFVLGAAPLVPGTEHVRVETRSAAGDTTSRRDLLIDADYTLDYATGTLFLNRPIAVVSANGDSTWFVVEYQYAPGTEYTTSVIAGGRAEVRVHKTTTLGLTVFSEDAAPDRHTGADLTAKVHTLPVDASAELALTNHGPVQPANQGDDPTAFRLKASVHPHKQVDVYGYLNRIGGGYDQRIVSRFLQPSGLPFGNLPPAVPIYTPLMIQNLYDGQHDFPFVLQQEADRFEWGLGAQYRPTKDLDLDAGTFDVSSNLDGLPSLTSSTRHTDYLLAAYHHLNWPTFFVGTTGTTDSATGVFDRAELVGVRQAKGKLLVDAEYRHHDDFGDTAPLSGNAGILRARLNLIEKLQPTGLVELVEDHQTENCINACPQKTTQLYAIGFESLWKQWRAFAYLDASAAEDSSNPQGSTNAHGGFFGVGLLFARIYGDLRVDLIDDSLLGFYASAGARLRVLISESLSASASLLVRSGTNVDARDTFDDTFGLAYRPRQRGRLFAFLKVHDKQTPSRTDKEVARHLTVVTADVVLPVSRRLNLGWRGAWSSSSSAADDPVVLSMGAAEATLHVKRFDFVAGMRVAATSQGGDFSLGTTLGAGMWFDDTYRLMVGVNLAQHDWAFEADESIPGLFINVTGTYGAAGAPAVMTH